MTLIIILTVLNIIAFIILYRFQSGLINLIHETRITHYSIEEKVKECFILLINSDFDKNLILSNLIDLGVSLDNKFIDKLIPKDTFNEFQNLLNDDTIKLPFHKNFIISKLNISEFLFNYMISNKDKISEYYEKG